MLTALASSIVYRRFRLSRGSPPALAAIMIFLAILLQILPRLASLAPLARLIFDQCECPAIVGSGEAVASCWLLVGASRVAFQPATRNQQLATLHPIVPPAPVDPASQ